MKAWKAKCLSSLSHPSWCSPRQATETRVLPRDDYRKQNFFSPKPATKQKTMSSLPQPFLVQLVMTLGPLLQRPCSTAGRRNAAVDTLRTRPRCVSAPGCFCYSDLLHPIHHVSTFCPYFVALKSKNWYHIRDFGSPTQRLLCPKKTMARCSYCALSG